MPPAPTREWAAGLRVMLAEPGAAGRDAAGERLREKELAAAIADRTGTDAGRDLYPRLVAARGWPRTRGHGAVGARRPTGDRSKVLLPRALPWWPPDFPRRGPSRFPSLNRSCCLPPSAPSCPREENCHAHDVVIVGGRAERADARLRAGTGRGASGRAGASARAHPRSTGPTVWSVRWCGCSTGAVSTHGSAAARTAPARAPLHVRRVPAGPQPGSMTTREPAPGAAAQDRKDAGRTRPRTRRRHPPGARGDRIRPGRRPRTVEVSGPAGPTLIETHYLVGADGGHSVVRKLSGIGFPGVTTDDSVARSANASCRPTGRSRTAAWTFPATGASRRSCTTAPSAG